jgi:hypothetical protein
MKRVLVTLLVLTVILGTVSSVFAASYSDVPKGSKFENAVGVLSTLGILSGFPDGTFKPGDTITRAQFAKVAVCSLGLESAAEYAKGVTVFSDVPATHWASGYINVAADQGLIKGYADGTYQPEAPVKYSEALAILVRVLGYEPIVKGTWPTNYLVKAAEIGISGDVTFSANAPATRGDVALFLYTSMEIGMMEQVTAGDLIQYEVTDKTLLDKLGFEADTGVVEGTNDMFGTGLEADEVSIDGDTVELAEGANLDAQLGLEVKFWVNSAGKIVFAKTLTQSSDIITGTIKHITDEGDEIKVGTKTYDTAGGAIMVHNNAWYDWDDIVVDDPYFEGGDVTLVLDDEGDTAFVIATQFDQSVIIASINTKFDRWAVWVDSDATATYKLDDYEACLFVKDGVEVEYDDFVKFDVAHMFEVTVDSDDYLYMELYNEKADGEVEEVSVDADDVITVTVDGEDYTLAADATYSTDDNDTIDVVTEDIMEDFAGNDAVLLLNRDGDGRHIYGDFVAESETYTAVVKSEWYSIETDPTEDPNYYVRFFKLDGTSVRYELTEDTEIDGDVVDLDEIITGNDDYDTDVPVGTLIDFALDKNGKLATVDTVGPDDTCDMDEDAIDEDGNRLIGDVGDYRVTTGAKFVDIEEWEVVTWLALEGATFDSACDGTSLYTGGDNSLEYAVYDSDGHNVDYGVEEADVGVVLSRRVTADGVAVKILVEAKTYTYQVAEVDPASLEDSNEGTATDVWADIDIGDLVDFDFEDNDFTALDEPVADEVFLGLYSYWVEDIDIDDLILVVRDAEDPDGAGTEDLLLSEEVVVYDVTGTPVQGDLEDISVDGLVQVFDLDADGLIDYIKIVE